LVVRFGPIRDAKKKYVIRPHEISPTRARPSVSKRETHSSNAKHVSTLSSSTRKAKVPTS